MESGILRTDLGFRAPECSATFLQWEMVGGVSEIWLPCLDMARGGVGWRNGDRP